ncbi:MAG: alpha/beta hydrolase [Algibacter sp.]
MKMKIVLALITLTFSFVVEVQGQVSFEPDSTLYYKTTAQGKLEMHLFKPENYKVSEKGPVIIFFFGGGWTGGNPKQFYQQARYFANKGILTISAEYRIKSKHKTSPFECVSDGKSAVRWVRVHADALGINPNKIIVSGGSAGGHVAACTGVIDGYDEVSDDLNISSIPNAMLLFNPVIDTTEKGYGIDKVGENRKTDISPCHHVESGIVPTLICHGTADKTVSFENVERFTKLMNEAGNICKLIPFENKGHGFFNGSFFRKNNTDEDFNITMEESIDFLAKINMVTN